jgi:hypothetical protein
LDFKTTLEVSTFPFQISYEDDLLFLGSCFAENISAYFDERKFQVQKNPFGILYHPQAILKSLEMALDTNHGLQKHSFEYNGVWSNFHCHSSLSSISEQEHISNVSKAQSALNKAIKQSSVIFVSLGTAWVYKHIDSSQIVANCHKLPQKLFEKQLLDLNTVSSSLSQIASKISDYNNQANIVFTLSPVRHLRDGFVENQMSKSILHLAIQNVVKANTNCFYFPSYEILLDDLRDYRFYTSDFLHPNEMALNYIWDKIKQTFFDQKTDQAIKIVEKINKRLSHRFFNPDHQESKLFKQKTSRIIADFQKQYPQIQF